MKAAVYYPGEGIRIDERPIPAPQPDQLLIQVGAAGICGSDMHYYRDGHIGDWWVRQPHVLGHEFAGTVAAIGSAVTGFRVGDRVAIEPIIPCETCPTCRSGLYNLCPNLRFTGSPHTDGAFQDYVAVRPRFAHLLPPEMDFELAALVEPTSIAVHAVRRSRLQVGETAAVVGAGPIGLLTLAVALAGGARQVFITDVDVPRLQKAAALKGTAIHASDDVVIAVQTQTEARGADVVFEAVGSASTLESSLKLVRPGGRLVVIGVSPEAKVEFDLMTAQAKEVDVIPVYLGRDAFPAALALLASGRVNGRAMITHRFPLTAMRDAMETAVHKRGDAIKVIVQPEPTV
jgi:L-iditol 2-dehydrogenase